MVVGYSGLDGAREFWSQQVAGSCHPGMDNFYQGQDAAAALFVDGVLTVAVQQERFSGVKFDGSFPVDAIRWCLAEAGLDVRDVTHLAHNFDYRGMRQFYAGSAEGARLFDEVYSPKVQDRVARRHFPELRPDLSPRGVRHHLAHALSAVVPSGLSRAAVLVVDGMGEAESVTMWHWRDGELRTVRSFGPTSSLGIFYSLITVHLGFVAAVDEYKVMALAALGDPTRYAQAMGAFVTLTRRGVRVPVLDWSDPTGRYEKSLRLLSESVTAPRRLGDPLTAEHHDVAAAAQGRLQQALSHLVEVVCRLTGERRVVLTGGVALNCSAVGVIGDQGDVDSVYVPFAPSDEGTAIGAGLAALANPADGHVGLMPFLGPHVTQTAARAAPDFTLSPEVVRRLVARQLADGAVVGWAQGRLEFGPRALGNRSILATPTSPELRDRVNAVIKEREAFRPLAPAFAAEYIDHWFERTQAVELRYMTASRHVRPEFRSLLRGVLHVDGTARVQSVRQNEHPVFWSLIDEFGRLTGVPGLLNTSMNLRGQPIVATEAQAVAMFVDSDLDIMAVGCRVWAKPRWRTHIDKWLRSEALRRA